MPVLRPRAQVEVPLGRRGHPSGDLSTCWPSGQDVVLHSSTRPRSTLCPSVPGPIRSFSERPVGTSLGTTLYIPGISVQARAPRWPLTGRGAATPGEGGGLRDFTLRLLRWTLFSSPICPPSGAAQESRWSRAPSESSLFLARTRPQGMSVCARVPWGWGMATGQPVPGPSSCGLILPCRLLGRPPVPQSVSPKHLVSRTWDLHNLGLVSRGRTPPTGQQSTVVEPRLPCQVGLCSNPSTCFLAV